MLLQLHRSEIDKTSSNYRRSCSSPSRSRSNSIDSSHSPKRKSTSTATSIPQIDTDTDSDLDDDYEDDFEVSRISTATPSSKKSVNVSYEDGFDSRSVRKNNNVHIHIPKRGLSPRTKTKTSKTKSPSKNENKSNADKYLKQKDTSSFGSLPASMNTSKSNSEHRNDITTSNDHLGSALLNSQALFRKQLSSLKSRLDIANSSYYDAMLRNSK